MELFTNNFRDPMAAASNGLMTGMQIRAVQQAFADQEMIKQREQAFAQDIAAIGQKPTTDAYIGLLSKYPDKAQQLRAGYDMLDAEKQKGMLSQVMPIYTALHTGNTGIAKQLAERSATAAENSGDVQTAQSMRQYLAALDANPALATGLMGTTLANVLGPEKFKATLSALDVPGAQRSAALDSSTKQVDYDRKLFELQQAKAEAPTKAEANRLDLEIKRLQAEEGPRKAMYDMQGQELDMEAKRADIRAKNATTAQQSRYGISPEISKITLPMYQTADQQESFANRLTDLSSRWEKTFADAPSAGGVLSVMNEKLKNWRGVDTEEGRIRRELETVLTADVLNRLGQLKGPSSEKEMEQVKKGLPASTDNPGVVLDYLKRATALAKEASDMERTRAQWLENFGTAGPSRIDGEVEGIQVPRGTSFMDFMRHKAKFGAGQSGAARAYDKYRTFGQ